MKNQCARKAETLTSLEMLATERAIQNQIGNDNAKCQRRHLVAGGDVRVRSGYSRRLPQWMKAESARIIIRRDGVPRNNATFLETVAGLAAAKVLCHMCE